MAWTIKPNGSWGTATTSSPGTELTAALALPGSWPWYPYGTTVIVRADQQAGLLTPTLPVAGAIGWWDATQIAGVADGASLATWPDLTANHYDLAQVTGVRQPTFYKTTAGQLVNGKPAVQFNGANTNWMRISSPPTVPQPCTMFLVAGTASPAGTGVIIDGATIARFCIYFTGGNYTVVVGATNSGTATAITAGQHALALVANNPSASTFYLDGASHFAGNGQATNPVPFTFGADYTNATAMTGFICEVALYPSALTAGNVASLTAYAQAKWGTP